MTPGADHPLGRRHRRGGALALIRRHELHPALAAACSSPCRRSRRRPGVCSDSCTSSGCCANPPHERLGAILDDSLEPVPVTASAAEVARLLASYDLVLAAGDRRGPPPVGAISIDDVLDYLLPDDWRSHDSDGHLVLREGGPLMPPVAAPSMPPAAARRGPRTTSRAIGSAGSRSGSPVRWGPPAFLVIL